MHVIIFLIINKDISLFLSLCRHFWSIFAKECRWWKECCDPWLVCNTFSDACWWMYVYVQYHILCRYCYVVQYCEVLTFVTVLCSDIFNVFSDVWSFLKQFFYFIKPGWIVDFVRFDVPICMGVACSLLIHLFTILYVLHVASTMLNVLVTFLECSCFIAESCFVTSCSCCLV